MHPGETRSFQPARSSFSKWSSCRGLHTAAYHLTAITRYRNAVADLL
jgi:hypothetical protein